MGSGTELSFQPRERRIKLGSCYSLSGFSTPGLGVYLAEGLTMAGDASLGKCCGCAQ